MYTAAQVDASSASKPFRQTLSGQAILVVAASLFVAACAHLSVPLPFTPVPLTLSDLAVLIVGLTLSPAAAFSALALYLLEGASGLPVFSPAGPGGMAQLLGPTGGFLISYPFAAASAGFLQQQFRRALSSDFAAALGGTAIASTLLMLCGVVWLAFLLHLAPSAAFTKGALPFLPGQLVKIFAAAGIVTSSRRLFAR